MYIIGYITHFQRGMKSRITGQEQIFVLEQTNTYSKAIYLRL